MMRFTLHFFLAVTILFIGVLLGMQQANEGVTKMKGYSDPSFQEVFHFSKEEATIMGNTVTSEDLEEKKRRLEEMKTFNIFSELGKKLANAIHFVVEQLLHMFRRIFE
jgi:hypothetical protein